MSAGCMAGRGHLRDKDGKLLSVIVILNLIVTLVPIIVLTLIVAINLMTILILIATLSLIEALFPTLLSSPNLSSSPHQPCPPRWTQGHDCIIASVFLWELHLRYGFRTGHIRFKYW